MEKKEIGYKKKKDDSVFELQDQLNTYINEISKIPILTQEEERELYEQMKEKDKKAILKLVRHNLRFVVSVARKYKNSNISLMELINEGNVGLIYAAKKFDPTKNVRFLSYAAWWIKHYIIKFLLEQSGPIKIPFKAQNKIKKLNDIRSLYLKQFNYSMTDEELSTASSISLKNIRKIDGYKYHFYSLDNNISDEANNNTSLCDILNVPQGRTLEESQIESALIENVKMLISELSERERTIISLRYGLLDNDTHTLQEIGDMFGISKERVRQIENDIIKKLRKRLKKTNESL